MTFEVQIIALFAVDVSQLFVDLLNIDLQMKEN